MESPDLYLSLIAEEYIGWGICSKYLIREISKRIPTVVIDPGLPKGTRIDGRVFHTIGDHHLKKVIDVSGSLNFGYTFFENLPPENAPENAKAFDRIFAGSTWCKEKLVENGIDWSDVLIQGIDPDLFYPIEDPKPGARDYFVVYSGGKFELRKGQDLVIRALAVFQERHKDVLLVTCWHNAWPMSFNTMADSPLIRYRPRRRLDRSACYMLLSENGIDMDRIEILPRIPQHQMRKVYANTDIGLFPNRCEGGTNLVLMEYMACAKPVIATWTSGHKDILTEANCIPLDRLRPFELTNTSGRLEAVWEEPELDDIIDRLEFAYQHRDIIDRIGRRAGEDMRQRTWARSACDLIGQLDLTLRSPC